MSKQDMTRDRSMYVCRIYASGTRRNKGMRSPSEEIDVCRARYLVYDRVSTLTFPTSGASIRMTTPWKMGIFVSRNSNHANPSTLKNT